jgi:hypothetical protein
MPKSLPWTKTGNPVFSSFAPSALSETTDGSDSLLRHVKAEHYAGISGFFLKTQLALVGLKNRERAAIEVAKRHQLLLESPAGEA